MEYLLQKKYFILALLTLVFLATRFLGFNQIYHQDEYKWAMIVNPSFGMQLESQHPPLDAILYRVSGNIFGFEHLRVVPIVASILLFALVYIFVKKYYGKSAALWSSLILLISCYELIASIQIDIDGALLPLVGMISIYCYYRLDLNDFRAKDNRKWGALFLLSIVLGFTIKLSYVIFLGAIATEALLVLRKRYGNEALRIFTKLVSVIGAALLLTVLVILVAKYVFHIANISQFLVHAKEFSLLNLSSRNYMQVAFLTLKSLVFASPLLLFPYLLFMNRKEEVSELRLWLILLFYSTVFYYVLFDFSNRTLERYNMFLILPGAIVGGILLSREYERLTTWTLSKDKEKFIWIAACFGAAFTLIPLLLSYDVIALNPKTAFIDHVRHLNFKFLIPLSGGSGPIGFYVPALFTLWSFALALASIVAFVLKKRGVFLGIFIGVCVACNLFTMNEFAFGTMYGNASSVAADVVSVTLASSTIPQVITYNDIGGYELSASGKYFKRFYTDPMFAETNVGKFESYKGDYLVVDFPAIDKGGIYWKYLMTCKETYRKTHADITGYIFDCRAGDSMIFTSNK